MTIPTEITGLIGQLTDAANNLTDASAVAIIKVQQIADAASAIVNPKPTIAAGVAASTGEGYVFTVYKGGPDGLTRTKRFQMISGSPVVVVELVDGSEYDQLAGPTPATAPQFFESIDPNVQNRTLLLDSDKRIVAMFPDPALAALQSQALVNGEFETLDANTDGEVWIKDSDNRVLAKMPTTAVIDKVNNLSTTVTNLASTAVVSDIFESLIPNQLLVMDTDKRILASIASEAASQAALDAVVSEVTSARSTQSSVNTRLSHGLTPYGDPIGPVSSKWSLREMPFRLRKRLLGESIQIVIALIGDSYTQNPTRYAQALTKLLQDTYGNAGIGYLSFGYFGSNSGPWSIGNQPTGQDICARSDLMTLTFIGSWTCSYIIPSANTPSLSQVVSSIADDYIKFTVPSGHNACRLFYTGDGTGTISVSWDDGVTYGSNINLSTVGAANVLLTGVPSTASSARIKVVSGNVALAGVDLQSSNSGVRVHKLGASGSRAGQWAAVTSATWSSQIAALGSHMHQVMHGTNDQSISTPPATFSNSHLSTIFTNIRSVLPYSDRLIAMPAENQRTTNTVTMLSLAQAAREYAIANDCAFLDLQYYFGSPANFAFEYSYANTARQWYSSDLIHPDPSTGGRVIVDAVYRLLTTY